MSAIAAAVRKTLFGLSPEEVSFDRRGFFYREPELRAHLETSGGGFLDGFNLALEEPRPYPLAARLEQLEPRFHGFAYEGAAMALTLFDLMFPWRRSRFETFISGPANRHIYMAYVGAGWAMARLCPLFERRRRKLDPLLSWLTVDGYGFHEGFFHPDRAYGAKKRPSRLKGYALKAFDQGLGRCTWFFKGGDAAAIIEIIESFPESRRADLWSGVGLACAYAGGASAEEVKRLKAAAGPNAGWLAQGAAFAAKARQRGGNPVPHNDLAVSLLCGKSLAEAAQICDDTLRQLPMGEATPGYELWRRRIHDLFISQAQAA